MKNIYKCRVLLPFIADLEKIAGRRVEGADTQKAFTVQMLEDTFLKNFVPAVSGLIVAATK